MKKVPKFLFAASIAMLTGVSSCNKLVKPAFEQIDSCKECGGNFTGNFSMEKVKLNYDNETKDWKISNSKFIASIPCKFPTELLIENKEIIFDGKFKDSPFFGQVTSIICIEKIY
jgi:hypothetical protein